MKKTNKNNLKEKGAGREKAIKATAQVYCWRTKTLGKKKKDSPVKAYGGEPITVRRKEREGEED